MHGVEPKGQVKLTSLVVPTRLDPSDHILLVQCVFPAHDVERHEGPVGPIEAQVIRQMVGEVLSLCEGSVGTPVSPTSTKTARASCKRLTELRDWM